MSKLLLPRRRFLQGLGAAGASLLLPAPAKAAIILNSYGFAQNTMLAAIQSLSLTTGLKLCLDSGDIASWPGSGTKWLDVSGGGYDFFLGTDETAEAVDPDFVGTPGGQTSSDYWDFDGAEYFTYDGSNETWMENLHKNSAIWAGCMWVYCTDVPPPAVDILMGTSDSNVNNIGVAVRVETAAEAEPGALYIRITNGSGTHAREVVSTATPTENSWNFLAWQISEGAGTGFTQVNATQEDETTTYSSPSSSSATYTMQVGAGGDPGGTSGPITSGWRMASANMWEGTVPSKANMLSLYNATKAKFGH